MYGGNDYLVLHNVACIYAEMSKADKAHEIEHQEMVVTTLRKAIDLWRQGRTNGPDELLLIRQESAFAPALRATPEFKKLLTP